MKNEKIAALLDSIESNLFRDFGYHLLTCIEERFTTAPASHSPNRHHCYEGGLTDHSVSVATLALQMARHYNNVDKDIVILGALLHDVGKICSYDKVNDSYEYSRKGKLHHHIPLGYHIVARAAEQFNSCGDYLSQERLDNLLHIIISHHGRLEWRSNVEPQTPEAIIVHACDLTDAYVFRMQAALPSEVK
jgi:3'-5' exoribonuclease